MRLRMLIALMTNILVHTFAGAQVVEFENYAEWELAAGSFTTIDFTGFPKFTFITDQYLDSGILFTDGDDNIAGPAPIGYPLDSWGLDGNETTHLEFITPIHSIGIYFPGIVQFTLYNEGIPFYTSSEFHAPGLSGFAGLHSTASFDSVLMDATPGFQIAIDNLYFGPPIPAPTTIPVLAALGLGSRRRRRRLQ